MNSKTMKLQEALNKGKAYYREHVQGNAMEEDKRFHMVEENNDYTIFLDNNTVDLNDPALLSISEGNGQQDFMDRYAQLEENNDYCEVIDSSAYRVCAIPRKQ